jgi:hypothetical protein
MRVDDFIMCKEVGSRRRSGGCQGFEVQEIREEREVNGGKAALRNDEKRKGRVGAGWGGVSGSDSSAVKDPNKHTFRYKKTVGEDERNQDIDDVMAKLRWDKDNDLIKGLHRGVGCHHAGLPHRYRVAVELLFRTGDLNVLFATATLAMGIHGPARSVVLLRDASFLNATSLRQMAGRAGRRGFDDLGNCVFLGIPYARLKMLLNSPVPLMRDAFPLSKSLVLRLSLLESWNKSKNFKGVGVQSQADNGATTAGSTDGGRKRWRGQNFLQHYADFAKLLLKQVRILFV